MNNVTFIDKLVEASDRPKRYVIRFGDFKMGHPELGWMRYLKSALRRDAINWAEYEEQRYARFIRRHLGKRAHVEDGVVFIER